MSKYKVLKSRWWHRLIIVCIWVLSSFILFLSIVLFFDVKKTDPVFDIDPKFSSISGDTYQLNSNTNPIIKKKYISYVMSQSYNPELISFNCIRAIVVNLRDNKISDNEIIEIIGINSQLRFDCSTGGYPSWRKNTYIPAENLFFFLMPLISFFGLWFFYHKIILYIIYGNKLPKK